MIASSFQTELPPSPAIRSFALPAGLSFQSQHFGATGQYQFAVMSGRDTGGQQSRASMRTGWGAFTFTASAERDTNAPTLSFIFGQVAGLQQILDQQGIRATTVQQVDELLSSDAYLIAAGYIKGATINLVPVRTQIAATADWSSRGAHRKQLSYGFLYNDNQLLEGSTQEIVHTVSYTQKITRKDDLSLACSIQGVTNPGAPQEYAPICYAAWRHQFQHVPYFIVPERRGTIAGKVFRDNHSTGDLAPGAPPLAEVEITLDDHRRTRSREDGSYRFTNVPRGAHRVTAMYHSAEPFFFTTPADLEVQENATVNFGIGYTLSGLTGQVLNDAEQGVAGVRVVLRNKESKWNATTEADGRFFVSSLTAGDYRVQVDEDSLPSGYSADGLAELPGVIVAASAPGTAAFTVRALRSISGRVLRYDSTAAGYVPVIHAQVVLDRPAVATVTDQLGRYLFRDLAAGSYTILVPNEAQTPSRAIRLGAQPIDLKDVDFRLREPDAVNVAASTAPPVQFPKPLPVRTQALIAPASH